MRVTRKTFSSSSTYLHIVGNIGNKNNFQLIIKYTDFSIHCIANNMYLFIIFVFVHKHQNQLKRMTV